MDIVISDARTILCPLPKHLLAVTDTRLFHACQLPKHLGNTVQLQIQLSSKCVSLVNGVYISEHLFRVLVALLTNWKQLSLRNTPS